MKLTKVFIAILIFIIFSFYNVVYAGFIEYKGGAKGLIKSEEKLFLDFEGLMPGDTVTNTVDIKNNTNGDAFIYFKPQKSNQINNLLENLELKIVLLYGKKSVEIYNGPLGSDSIKKYIYIGRYLNGFNGKLKFDITVPIELDNIIAGNYVQLNWIFASSNIYIDDESIVDIPKEIALNKNELYPDKEKPSNNTIINSTNNSVYENTNNVENFDNTTINPGNDNNNIFDNDNSNNNIYDNTNDVKDNFDLSNVGTTVDSVIVDNTIENIKTGDNILKTFQILVMALISLIIITIYKNRKRKEEKK